MTDMGSNTEAPKAILANGSGTTIPDPFDPMKYVLPQNFVQSCGVKKLRTTVPVKKPHNQDWVRVHPDPSYRKDFPVLELKDVGEFYLVNPALADGLVGRVSFRTLFTTVNRQGVVSLWPVMLAAADGRTHGAHLSAREAAERAMATWTNLVWNRGLGAYEISAGTYSGEPQWPEESFPQLLEIAFRGHHIDSFDHPAVAQLLGR